MHASLSRMKCVAGGRGSQIPAMHALAGLLGASGPEEDWSTANAVLRPKLEACLQVFTVF